MIPGIQHRCIFLLIVAGWLATGKASTCNETLVDTVTDDKLTASSSFNDWCSAEKSRLSTSNGWRPEITDNNTWIQAIVTKGSERAEEYVMKYMVEYRNTTSSWITVTNGISNEFTANSDPTTPVINNLPDPIVARYIRLYPTECSDYCILRFDFIGCGASECSKSMVDNVTDDKLTASSSFIGRSITKTPDMAKLSSKGWSPNLDDTYPWIQVDFGRHIAIKGVVSMGSATQYAHVKEYRVNYSSTTSSWKPVVDAEFQLHTFTANTDPTTPVTNYLPSPIVARYVRILPTDFYFYISLRFDVIGCEVTTPTSTTLAVSSSTTSTQRTLTTVNRQTTTKTLPEPTTTKFLSSPTTTMTLPSLITSATSASPTISTAVGATQLADTTFKPTLFNSTQVGFCTCICTETNDSMTPQKVQARIETIVQNLTVSKKKTSKYIRSKTSAQDSRPEVVYVGSVAIVILCMFASLIVLPDLYTLLRFIYAMLKCKEK
uniref:F5/8 type C domain-containing protein n=1 Tax=Magallana gigas TaxID=29159 RepID=A0A8W8HLS1_MAGGI